MLLGIPIVKSLTSLEGITDDVQILCQAWIVFDYNARLIMATSLFKWGDKTAMMADKIN